MSNDKALTIVEAAQSPQAFTVSNVSAAEIEYQKMIREHKAIIRQTREFKERYDVAFLKLVDAWFAENHPGVQYRVELSGPGDDRTVIFNAKLAIDAPGSREIHREFSEFFDLLWF